MFAGSASVKHSFMKAELKSGSRSQSSFGSISLKKIMKKTESKELSGEDLKHELQNLVQSKAELESQVFKTMFEMKKLKSVSKSLKVKEKEMMTFQAALIKSNENLVESRGKLERYEGLLREIFNQIHLGGAEVHQMMSKKQTKLKNKRKSLVFEDMPLITEQNRTSIDTTRNVRIRNPVIFNNFAATPKLKKLSSLNTPTKISLNSNKNEDSAVRINENFQMILNRLSNLLKYTL